MSFEDVLVFPLQQDTDPRTRRRLMISGGLRNAITVIRTSTASTSILEARRIVKETFNLGPNIAYVLKQGTRLRRRVVCHSFPSGPVSGHCERLMSETHSNFRIRNMLYDKIQMGGSGTLVKRKTQESKMKCKVSRIAHEDSKSKLKT